MNPAAIHLDAEYGKGTPFGERIVNSVFTLGLLVGLSVYDTTYGTTIGNLGWEEVRFPKPVLNFSICATPCRKRDGPPSASVPWS